VVPPARTPLRADRLRAVNVPVPVTVELDALERPVAVTTVRGIPCAVESVLETWRLDDEWWRVLIARRYVEAVLDGGRHVVLYCDLGTGEWWMQTP